VRAGSCLSGGDIAELRLLAGRKLIP